MACRELLLQQSLNRREVRGLDSTQSRGFPSFATSGRNLQLTYRQRSVNVPVNVAKMLAGGSILEFSSITSKKNLYFLLLMLGIPKTLPLPAFSQR